MSQVWLVNWIDYLEVVLTNAVMLLSCLVAKNLSSRALSIHLCILIHTLVYTMFVHYVLGSIELPSQWSSMDDNEHVKLEPLQPTSQEYKKVETTFMSTAQRTVNTVQKVNELIFNYIFLYIYETAFRMLLNLI